MLVYGECECFVMQMLYVCVLCASCDSSQCCILHDLQFVNAGRGCNRRPYRRGILQNRSHNCFIGSHEGPPSVYPADKLVWGVGSWPSYRATEGSNPKGTRLYFVILLKNVEKIFDLH